MLLSRRLSKAVAPLGVAAALFAIAPSASAVTVEKIVAVIGDDAILLSELRARGAPFARQITKQYPAGPQRTATESSMYKDLLQKMVEDTLEVQAAERLKVVIKPEEVDKTFEQMAASQNMTVEQLFQATEAKTGMTEQDYRDEIRRQVLEGKLLSQRIRGRIRITEEDLKRAFSKTVREEKDRREYRPGWIALRIPPNATAKDIAAREALAAAIIKDLDQGVPFAELAETYSEDPKTKDNGGDFGIHAPAKSPTAQMGKRPVLPRELEDRVQALEEGEHSEPFRFGDGIVIMTVLSRQPSRYTTFEAAKPEMMQRVQNEIVARERDAWLIELKKRTHVQIRL